MNQTIFFQREVVQVLNTDMFRQDLSTSGTNAACKRLVALQIILNCGVCKLILGDIIDDKLVDAI